MLWTYACSVFFVHNIMFSCLPATHRSLQVHGDDEVGTIKLTMFGSDAEILVMSPDEYQLARHMNEPKEIDLGNFVLSPMPGTLISFAVKVRCNTNAVCLT